MKAKMTSTTRACLPTIAALLLAGAPAWADNSASIRFNNSFITDAGFDAVSENNHLVQVEFNFARRLMQIWELDLWVEGSYMVGPSKAELFSNQFQAKALLQSVTLGARFTYPLLYWLVPFARLGLGVGIGTLELSNTGGGQPAGQDSVEDRAAAFAGQLLVGVEILWPRSVIRRTGKGVTAGLVIEAGFGFASKLRFELRPEEDEELLQIPLSGSHLGSLSTTGAQVRVGGIIRF